ncbi:MAG: CopG family antitoxin [Chloroflexi bacterium]|nr:CopG family antitoxin [Chloroflexota bacterium]
MSEDRVSSISHSRTLEEMADFWDTHSLADYDDQTYEVEMTFDPSARRRIVTIEPELLADISQVAQVRKVSTQTLINVWLRQQVDRFLLQPAGAEEPIAAQVRRQRAG